MLALVVLLAAQRVLAIVTFPFYIEGDGYTYYHLLKDLQSSLIHATGYCLSFFPAKLLASVAGCSPADVLRILQHVVSVAAVAFLHQGLRLVVPRWLSFATCLLVGGDLLAVTAATTSRPEFWQADLIVLMAGALLRAMTSNDPRTKRRWYTGLGVVFGIAFATKYNSLPCAAFFAAPLLDRDLAFAARVRTALRCGIAAVLTLVVFVATFHWPTTGCVHFNLEHGWIHMQKLGLAKIPIVPENGIATRKYIALVHSLRNIGAGPSQWRSLDAVSPDERAPFRAKFGALLTTTDEGTVDAALAPFRSELRPGGTYHDPTDFCRIYHHLGLLETEELLADVYAEGKAARPHEYWSHVASIAAEGVGYRGAYLPYQPTTSLRPAFFEHADRGLFGDRLRVLMADDEVYLKEPEWAANFWRPGAELLSRFAFLRFVPEAVVWIAIGIGLLGGAFVARRDRRRLPVLALQITALLAVAGMIAFSALVFVFRPKELIAMQPLLVILAGLAVANVGWLARRGASAP